MYRAVGIVTLLLITTLVVVGSLTRTGAGPITISAPDTDGDGCNDQVEQNLNVGGERIGGARDPNNPLDFFDTTGDRRVTVLDTQRVTFRFGAIQGGLLYDSRYDREVTGTEPWDLGPGNGSITITDIAAALAQYGHVCEGPGAEWLLLQTWTGAKNEEELKAFFDPMVEPILDYQEQQAKAGAQAVATPVLPNGAWVACIAPDGTVFFDLPPQPVPDALLLTPTPVLVTPTSEPTPTEEEEVISDATC